MRRRACLRMLGLGALGFGTAQLLARSNDAMTNGLNAEPSVRPITLFLCGDVMTGRGIDQILPYPSEPGIYESYMKSAKGYVELAERIEGPIGIPVGFDYIWGDALTELDRAAPDLRLINLETAVTSSDNYWPDKGVNYRMHPANIPCLTAAGIDGCILANNHVMDWGREGLLETLGTLENVKVETAGAGRNLNEAAAPMIFELPGRGRVLLFAYGHLSSGVPWAWRAGGDQPGVNLLEGFSYEAVARVRGQVSSISQPGDLVIVSIHWGGNWGYEIPEEHQKFARQLIDEVGVGIIHGHSSHHPRAIEVYRGRPIFYGCGDFINDYEGISGYEEFRDDLTLMYLVTMDSVSGRLLRLEMTPLQIRRFRLQHPSEQDRLWLLRTMDRECSNFGARVRLSDADRFHLSYR